MKRIGSMTVTLILLLCAVLTVLPAPALAAGSNPDISLDAGVIAKNDTVWFGSYVSTNYDHSGPVQWRVLSPKGDGTLPVSGTEDVLLISNHLLEDGEVYFKQNGSSNQWAESDAQTWCTNLYTNWPANEKAAVKATTVAEQDTEHDDYYKDYFYEGGHFNEFYSAASLSGEHFFFLSAQEADTYFTGDDDRQAYSEYFDGSWYWWLRSPYTRNDNRAGYVNLRGWVNYTDVVDREGARPAFNLNLPSVLYTAAVSGESNAWKLGLYDSAMTVTEGSGGVTRSGSTVTVPYAIGGSDAGNATHVALLITNKNDAWSATDGWSSGAAKLYYETQAVSAASGSVSFTLPDSLKDKTCGTDYKAWLLAVDENGNHESDYASAPVSVTIPGKPLSGKCGDNLTWTVSDKDGNGSLETLTISGTGAMYNYTHDRGETLAPWRDYIGEITTVTVGEGATGIGNNAFHGCEAITTVSLPSTLESIGEFAFYGCTGLTAIEIPSKVAIIGMGAFEGCSNLQKVHISDLGAWCGITFGNSYANPLSNRVGLYINNQPVKNLDALPASVTQIKNYTFCGCSTLQSAALPDGVTEIGESAFSDCTSLESVTLPDSVTAIGKYAFDCCTSLESVTLPAGLSVSNIGDYAFKTCENLSHIYCTEEQGLGIMGRSFKLLSDTPLYINSRLIAAVPSPADGGTVTGGGLHAKNTSVTLTATAADGYIFKNWTEGGNSAGTSAALTFTAQNDRYLTANFALTSGKCGDSLTWAVSDKDGNGSFETLTISGTGAMYDYSYDMYNGVTTAPWRDYVGDITTVTVEEGATGIGNNAFHGCSAITAVSLPSTLESIGQFAFYRCTGLTAIDIPAKVTFIDTGAFEGCSSLQKVHISDLGAWCGIRFNSSSANPLSNGAGLYINNQPVTNLDALPASVTQIKNYAFCCCSTLVSAAIPDSVTAIGDFSFYLCTRLESVTLPAGLDVSNIGDHAFEKCDNLSHIYCTKAQGNDILDRRKKLLSNTPLYNNSCRIAAVPSPADGGTVTGTGLHAKNTSVILTAIPADGNVFKKWTEGGNDAGTSAALTFTAQNDRYLTANFGPETGNLKVTVYISGGVTKEEAEGALAFAVMKLNSEGGAEGWLDGDGNLVDGEVELTVSDFDTITNDESGFIASCVKEYTDIPAGSYKVRETNTAIEGFQFNEEASMIESADLSVSENSNTKAELRNVYSLIEISQKVTFKVVNGSWDDETLAAEHTVTLKGREGDTLKLTAAQIPAVGSKPAEHYKVGGWDVTPSTETAITQDTAYTYTYAQQNKITYTVTFKVQNGEWDLGGTADQKVTLSRYENEDLALKLAEDDIPAVGNKPNEHYKAGGWDTAPSTDTAINENKVYTYTYAAKSPISATVTFKVVNGGWDDETLTGDQTVTLTGYEGDTLKLTAAQIPAVGGKPGEGYAAGSWDTAPSTETAITGTVTYTYTYIADAAALKAAIQAASEYRDTIKDGYAAIAAQLTTAIEAAEEAANDPAQTPAGLSDAKDALESAVADAKDSVAVKDVTDKIDALPASDGVTLSDAADIQAARAAYDALTEDQQKKIGEDTLKKLTDDEAALAEAQAAADKETADAAAAKAVTDKIDALPAADEVTLDDQKAIEDARDAYDALTEDQQKKIGEDTLKKLTDDEAALAEAQAAADKETADAAAAKGVTDKIDALPAAEDVTLADAADIQAARDAYDALTEDQQKKIGEDTLKKLTDDEAALAEAQAAADKEAADTAAAKGVTDKIDALPAADEVTLDDQKAIEDARDAYDALTEDQQKKIGEDTLKKLTDDEAALAEAQAAADKETADTAAAKGVTDKIDALPAPEAVTKDNKAAIEAARAAYDALTEDQKAKVIDETVKKLTDCEAALAVALQPVVYTNETGGSPDHEIGAGDVAFTFKRSPADDEILSKFQTAKVDQKELTRDQDYTVRQGSLILTLKASFLDTLSVGKHTLTVTFEDGSADAEFTVTKAVDPANFDDVAVASDSFSFKVVWEGDPEASIDFTLYKQGGAVYHHGFDKKVVSKQEWKYDAWFSSPAACYLIETPLKGYITRYENVGVYAGVTDRCCDGGTIINKKLPKTGDDANLALWAGCVLAGAAGITALAVSKKRKKAQK